MVTTISLVHFVLLCRPGLCLEGLVRIEARVRREQEQVSWAAGATKGTWLNNMGGEAAGVGGNGTGTGTG